jgi:hypothetical protein
LELGCTERTAFGDVHVTDGLCRAQVGPYADTFEYEPRCIGQRKNAWIARVVLRLRFENNGIDPATGDGEGCH